MNKLQKIAEKLSLFNNLSFTKKQWETILKGCGCPTSPHLWTSLRRNNLVREKKFFTLIEMDSEAYTRIYNEYLEANNQCVRKHTAKVKARKKAESFKSFSVYVINGVVTSERPERDI